MALYYVIPYYMYKKNNYYDIIKWSLAEAKLLQTRRLYIRFYLNFEIVLNIISILYERQHVQN